MKKKGYSLFFDIDRNTAIGCNINAKEASKISSDLTKSYGEPEVSEVPFTSKDLITIFWKWDTAKGPITVMYDTGMTKAVYFS